MKAFGVHHYDDGGLIELSVPAPPRPAADEVQLGPYGTSMNPIDGLLAKGYGAPLFNPKGRFPVILGRDAVARVVAVGKGVRGLESGQRVLVACSPRTGGTWAERFNVPLRCVTPLDDQRLTDITAAGLGYAGITALQALAAVNLDATRAAGARLCINGASGGVGSIVLALAATWGAKVTAVASSPHHDWLRSLAPCTPVDYRDRDALSAIQADIVINLAPGNDPMLDLLHTSPANYRAYATTVTPLLSEITDKGTLKGLASGGALLMGKRFRLARHGIRYRWVVFKESARDLATLAGFFARHPHIDPVSQRLAQKHLPDATNGTGENIAPHGKTVFLKP
ncbi:alcohol dehydrogenase catalytic domain-containing protein [Alcanivoracaceae bacterium MT1]